MTDLTQFDLQNESKITLREYRAGDWRAMYALDVQCFTPPFRFTRSAMRDFAEGTDAITLLAEADGLLAGFCIVQLGDRTGYIVTLDVAPAHRRDGLASLLVQHIETRVSAAGADSMALHVFPGNTAAVSLYEALGYHTAETAPGFYGPGLDALLYRRPLDSPSRVETAAAMERIAAATERLAVLAG